jgi:hypothetical protein
VTADETAKSDVLSHITAELRALFPAVPPAVVAEHVRRAHAGVESAPVQDFMPVLVQRQARLSLAAFTSESSSAGSDADQRPSSA